MLFDCCHVALPSWTTEVDCGLRVSASGSAAPLLLVDKRTNKCRAAHFHSTSERLSPSDSCPCLPEVFFFSPLSRSHSLVFTFSSETSQDLPVIPFVPLLPGDRGWKQRSLFPTQLSPSRGTSASCCSFWESSETLLLWLLACAVFCSDYTKLKVTTSLAFSC